MLRSRALCVPTGRLRRRRPGAAAAAADRGRRCRLVCSSEKPPTVRRSGLSTNAESSDIGDMLMLQSGSALSIENPSVEDDDDDDDADDDLERPASLL